MAKAVKNVKTVSFAGTGRRKQSIARVRLVPGQGQFVVNGKNLDEYFGHGTHKSVAKQPLTLTKTEEKYDVTVNVNGGGFTGQAGAIRHGVARALCKADALRPRLERGFAQCLDRNDKGRSARRRTCHDIHTFQQRRTAYRQRQESQ